MSTDRLDQLIAAAAACLDCGREHECRDISTDDRPGKRYTWSDPGDGHPYRHATINVAWLREWRRKNA